MKNKNDKNKEKPAEKTASPIAPEILDFITNYLKKAGLSDDFIAHLHHVAAGQKTAFSFPKIGMDSADFMQEREKAKEAIRPLAGNVLGMDQASPEEIYRYGLNHIGIKTDHINLQGLKSLAEREANYRSPQNLILAKDQAGNTENFNPEEILSAYVASVQGHVKN
ncbi:hypothetical protein FAI41_04530 [Acetobacteraceae bacterium]|nr:hypothetical protein FAI41_04530 [Acetobacteraceae bacterium]